MLYLVNPRYADLIPIIRPVFDSIKPGMLQFSGDACMFDTEDAAPLAKALNALNGLPADLILIAE